MCEITEGRDVTCDSAGGSQIAYIYSLVDSLGVSNYSTPPTIVDGIVTAMALKPTKFLHAINVQAETIEATVNSIGESAKSSAAHEHSTIITLAGNTSDDIKVATQIVKGRVGVILKLNDGTYELFHFQEGFGGKVQRARSTGKLLDDMNGSVWTITSRQPLPEAKIPSTIVDSMLP